MVEIDDLEIIYNAESTHLEECVFWLPLMSGNLRALHASVTQALRLTPNRYATRKCPASWDMIISLYSGNNFW